MFRQETHAKRFDFALEPGERILITCKEDRINWDYDMDEYRGQWLTVCYMGTYNDGHQTNDTLHYFFVEEDNNQYFWDPQHIDAVMRHNAFIPGNFRGDPQLPIL